MSHLGTAHGTIRLDLTTYPDRHGFVESGPGIEPTTIKGCIVCPACHLPRLHPVHREAAPGYSDTEGRLVCGAGVGFSLQPPGVCGRAPGHTDDNPHSPHLAAVHHCAEHRLVFDSWDDARDHGAGPLHRITLDHLTSTFVGTYPAKAYRDGVHIGPGRWLDVVRAANGYRPGMFTAPTYADDDEHGVTELYAEAFVRHNADESVTIMCATDGGVAALRAAHRDVAAV